MAVEAAHRWRDLVTGALVGAAAPAHTWAVIVALPAADDAIHALVDEDAHLTLCYLGDVDQLPRATLATAAASLELLAEQLGPFQATASGTAQLGPDRAHVLLVEGTALGNVRDLLLADPGIARAARTAEHPQWIAHVTLSYASPPDADDVADVHAVRFDRLALWAGDKRTEYPLTGRPRGDARPAWDDGDAVVAAGSFSLPACTTLGELRAAVKLADADPRLRGLVTKGAARLGLLASLPGWPEVAETVVHADRRAWRVRAGQLVDPATGEVHGGQAVVTAATAPATWPTITSTAELFLAIRKGPTDPGVRVFLIKHAARLDRLRWVPADWPERRRVRLSRNGADYALLDDNTLRKLGVHVTDEGRRELAAYTAHEPAPPTPSNHDPAAMPVLPLPVHPDPAEIVNGGLR